MPKGKVLTIQEIASDFIKSIKAFNDIIMEYRKDFEESQENKNEQDDRKQS